MSDSAPRTFNICVLGLWHLGTVTAACLAAAGHRVKGLDFDTETVKLLQQGKPPIFEPGLEDLVREGIQAGRLSFTSDLAKATEGIDLLWVAYDTPVDADDRADVPFVMNRVERVLPHLRSRAIVLVSSQLPVGSTRTLEQKCRLLGIGKDVTFAYSPENLRLGKAIAAFTQADRTVVGFRDERDRPGLESLFGKFATRIEWMSVESAEMTKHALNAFLATSVSFINEIAVICEQVGADAKEVERGLKSEPRIGPKAYLSPGGAFAGGTLARDIAFLSSIGQERKIPVALLQAVRTSNNFHREWARRKITAILGNLKGKTLAVWGLTYKPGTDTLRRSSSIEFCDWAFESGARVRAHDPAVKTLPAILSDRIALSATPTETLQGADALIVATEWPEYASIAADAVVAKMASPVVLDPNRFLSKQLEGNPSIRYFTVGKP